MLYFDHASGVLPDEETLQIIQQCFRRYPANQESVHPLAYEARRAFDLARSRLAVQLTGSDEYRAVAFPGGTAAIAALARWKRLYRRKVYTTALEHPSVSHALERAMAQCRYFDLDRNGRIVAGSCGGNDCDAVFITHIQSEIGTIQMADDIFARFGENTVKICDTIQSAAKLPLPRSADIMTVSGAKLGVPGAAALLVRKKYASEIEALAEKLRRDHEVCRIVVPLFIAMSEVAEIRVKQMQENAAHAEDLQTLCRTLAAKLGIACTIEEHFCSPYICHLNFPSAEGAVLVRLLGAENICVGSGTACSAETSEPSPALLALGFSKKSAFGGVRISFDCSTKLQDVKKLFDVLENTLKNY